MFSYRNVRPLAFCAIALATVCAPFATQAADAKIEGIWQQVHPNTLLKPADGKPIPFSADGRKRYDANRTAAAKGDYSFDATMTTCTSPGQPRLMLSAKPFAIFVRPRMVTMIYAWNRLFRQISVGPAFVSPALAPNYWEFGMVQGHPVGSWKGKTLVIKSDSFVPNGLLDALLPGSDHLTLTERIRLVGPTTLEDRITIDDPADYSRPWDAVVTYKRLSATAYPFAEDVCSDRLHAHVPAIKR